MRQVFSERAACFTLPVSGMVLAAAVMPPTDILGDNGAKRKPHSAPATTTSPTLCFVVRESQPSFFFAKLPNHDDGPQVGSPGKRGGGGGGGSLSAALGDLSAVSMPMNSLLPWAGSYRAPPMDVHCVAAAWEWESAGRIGAATRVCALDRRAHTVHVVTCADNCLRSEASTVALMELQRLNSIAGAGDAFVQAGGCLSSMLLRPCSATRPPTVLLWSNTAALVVEMTLFAGEGTAAGDVGVPLPNQCRVIDVPGVPESIAVLDDARILLQLEGPERSGNGGVVCVVTLPAFGSGAPADISWLDTQPTAVPRFCYQNGASGAGTITFREADTPVRCAHSVTRSIGSNSDIVPVVCYDWSSADIERGRVDPLASSEFSTGVDLSSSMSLHYHGGRTNGELFDVVDVTRGLVKRIEVAGATVSDSEPGSNSSSSLAPGVVGNGYVAPPHFPPRQAALPHRRYAKLA